MLPQLTDREVFAFVKRHHQKAELGNIDDILADYGEKVEHFDKGLVDKAFIRAEEERYHAPGHSISERVPAQLSLLPLGPDRIRVSYPLQFVRVAPDATWVKGVADVTLEIAMTPQGFRIVKQNSVPRESERKKGRGNIPILDP